mmetsp:Transcript_14961/g.33410  ORF Transcript_14961/g.33410 Transcript_14961/m.33410 type:complete len:178 (+) Transcript_14961:48-581(+)
MTARTSTTLSAPGPRNKVPIEEAQTILTSWNAILSSNASANPPVTVTTLDLSCRSWSLPVLTVLEPALMEIAPTVRTLKIDDVIASLPTEDGFATLAFFNRVFHPDLAECVTDVDLSDNALGTRSLDHIGDLLQRFTESSSSSSETAQLRHVQGGRSASVGEARPNDRPAAPIPPSR